MDKTLMVSWLKEFGKTFLKQGLPFIALAIIFAILESLLKG